VDHWLYGKKINEAGTSPFPDEKKDLGIPGEPPKKKGSGLLKDAEWVRPADVTRVLYKTQFLPAMTLQRIVSDIPGPVRLLVTRNVMDRWQHHVLIPQQSLLIGEQSGKPAFGESRLAFTVSEVHFPDGVILELGKAKLSDQSGQQGLTGQVDAHIPSLLLATGLSAVLNIGARSAVSGNGNQFRPSVEEDAVREAGQDAQQTAKGLIDRTLRRPPTITIKEGQEVTVQFSDNLSLAASPRIVK
jgi:type IV secretion system protein VirB10